MSEEKIKIGDMVKFFIDGERGQKIGQVISIKGEIASVFCDKDVKTYKVPVNTLKKV